MSGILKGLGSILTEVGTHIGTNPIDDNETKKHIDKTIQAVTGLVKHLNK